jgi:hypothetical protein
MASQADVRVFTLQEANSAIRDLREILPAMRETLQRIERMESRLSVLDLICDRAVSSENSDLQEYLSLKVKYHRAIHEFEAMLTHVGESGYLLRDLDKGIVHFPAKRGSETVLLCWSEGEEKIAHWHRLEASGGPDEENRYEIEKWDDL